MSDTKELGQRYIAALWDSARSLGVDDDAHNQLGSLVAAITEAEAQLAGLKLHLIHEAQLANADGVIAHVRGSVRSTAAQATTTLTLATELGQRFSMIATALNDGSISVAQADAIVSGLKKLPTTVTRTEMVTCQESILAYTDTLGPAELRHLAARLLEVIDPDQADAHHAQRLAAEERAAHRDRHLRLSPDHHGSIRITGQLPIADAALLQAQLDALTPPASSYHQTGETPTRDMRRADALVLLCHTAAAAPDGTLPSHGNHHPTVNITLDHDTLLTGLGTVSLLSSTDLHGITAGDARRLACHAGIIPIVLDSKSRPLDVGREKRLFTPAMIAALTERDQGCAFPSCTAAPAACHAHHIIPWWQSGPTSISNAVLLCPHHHRIVEPDPHLSADTQWEVHLDPTTGLAWFTPPRTIDPTRTPRQHTRFVLRSITLQPVTEAPPCPRASIFDDINHYTSPAWTQAS